MTRERSIAALALCLACLAGLGPVSGCDRLRGRAPATGEPAAPEAQGEPPAGAPPGALAPSGPMTPRMRAPSEARALSNAFASVARALRPSVVRIDVEISRQPHVSENEPGDEPGGGGDMAPFLRRFFHFGPGEREEEQVPQHGTGSGIVMDARGDILTNRHVVSGATTVKVTLDDGRELPAKTVGTDAETDVAVIRLDKPPADLTAARLGDSDKLEVGEWVLAIGSPLGLDQTVTAGIVSGKGRVGRHVQMSGGRVRHYIQTDAKINPGNSGGPLVNLSAEVVGINTLINTGPGGAYGFAIPINQVRMVADKLLKEGRVRYAYLGVLVGDVADLAPEQRAALDAAGKGEKLESGAYINQVTPGGPAARAGLRQGEVITDIDGHKMEGAGDVIDYVSGQAIGARVGVGLQQAGAHRVVQVTLGELPSQDKVAAEAGGGAGALGATLQTLTPDLARSMGLEPGVRGAVVAEVVPGGPAASAGLAAGDVILEVDRHQAATADDANALLRAPRKGGHLLRVRGAAGTRFVTIGQ
jgi:serine protease Do